MYEDDPVAKDDSGMTWRVAILAAASAVAGSLAGVIGSVFIAYEGFERETDTLVRDKQESAYLGFLSEANRLQFGLRYSALAQPKQPGSVELLTSAQSQVVIYGSDAARDAAQTMSLAMANAIGADHQEQASAWSDYDDAVVEFQLAVRDSLGVPG